MISMLNNNPTPDNAPTDLPTNAAAMNDDQLVQEVFNMIKVTRRASAFEVQHELGISGVHAARLMDMLEERGIVGPENGSNPREILVDLDSTRRLPSAPRQIEGPTHEAMGAIDNMMRRKHEMMGISSGFRDLDMLTCGFQRQEMIVLTARPCMGKTSLMFNFAEAAALPNDGKKGAGVLIFSLEMAASQLALRLLYSRARVNIQKLREGLCPPDGADAARLKQTAGELAKAPLYVDDTNPASIMELRAKARCLASRLAGTQTPLGFVIVDYFQRLCSAEFRAAREKQINEVSSGLKLLAKELNVPVLVLSSLKRAGALRDPRMSDIPNALEQDADVVLMLAKPWDADEKFQVAADSADLIVAKQRNGPIGIVRLTFLRDIARFENYAE